MSEIDFDKAVVADNNDRKRYELVLGEEAAFVEYILAKEMIVFTHTLVPQAYEGKGVANRVIRFALDDARARGLSVHPLCPFVAAFIRRHPEYQDLVT